MALIICVQGTNLTIDARIIEHSVLFQTNYIQAPNEEIPLSAEIITNEVWTFIQQYYEINDYKPKKIKINSDNPDKVFEQKERDLIMPISIQSPFLKQLILSARYLQMDSLMQFLIARIAIEVYVDPNDQVGSLKKLNQKYPNVPQISGADIKQYQEQAPFLLN